MNFNTTLRRFFMKKVIYPTFVLLACILMVPTARAQAAQEGTVQGIEATGDPTTGPSAPSAVSGSEGSAAGLNPEVGDTTNTLTSSTDPIGVVSANGELPSNANVVGRGDILFIDRDKNTVTVRDSSTGKMMVHSVRDAQMLQNLNQGDSVQLFSDR